MRAHSARLPACIALLLAAGAAPAGAKSLAVTTDYRLRALSYHNLSLGTPQLNHAFLSQSARLGMEFKDIALRGAEQGLPETVDFGMRLRALGVTGSTGPLTTPFDRIAEQYPSADFTPFFEHAYLRANNLGGAPWSLTVGRQGFSLGSGLLLDDNGAGLTGFSARGNLPWGGLKTEGFLLHSQTRATRFGAGNVTYAGFSLEYPTEGRWQLNQLIERDLSTQFVAPNGCQNLNPGGPGCLIGRATRWFSSLRYQLEYGPLVFDGEAALQKGAGNPTGPNPAGAHVAFNGNAQLIRAKWRQQFFTTKTGRTVRGIARAVVARGSGDDPGTAADEAFFPSAGLRFDGLERRGVGELFAATPYDAFGGQSSSTASGLPLRASGVLAFGAGVTPPAWHGITLDLDYFLFQADRNVGPTRTLGTELDVALRYDFRDLLQFRASVASFTAGAALNPDKPSSRRWMFEATGRFY